MAVNSYKKDETLKESVNIEIVGRLIAYLKPYKKQVTQVLLLMAVVVAVGLLNPYLL